jgi:hypothetical protein
MDKSHIHILIEDAIVQVQKYIVENQLSERHEIVTDVLKVLKLLQIECEMNGDSFSNRLLRGFKDICTFTAIQYEDTIFNDPIFKVYDEFAIQIRGFKELPLLRMDFGKGDPI